MKTCKKDVVGKKEFGSGDRWAIERPQILAVFSTASGMAPEALFYARKCEWLCRGADDQGRKRIGMVGSAIVFLIDPELGIARTRCFSAPRRGFRTFFQVLLVGRYRQLVATLIFQVSGVPLDVLELDLVKSASARPDASIVRHF